MAGTRASVVVVGHGAAGLAAALAAAEEARRADRAVAITLLERSTAQACGGNTRWSPGYMRMRSPEELAPGFEADILQCAGGRADQSYVRRLAAEAVPTIGWLERQGIAFHCPTYYLSAGPPRIQPIGGGEVIVRELARVGQSLGVSIRYECAAEKLLLGDDGALHGIAVKTARSESETLPADALVLASGGFQGNGAMLREHLGDGGESLRPISPGTSHDTGEGIRIALAAGACPSGDWHGMHCEPIDARSKNSAPVVLVYPYGIVVDQSGRRFFDEGAGLVHETWEAFARTIHFQAPNRVAYAILDAALYDITDYQRAIRSEVPPYRADSIAELARRAGIEPAGLVDSVARYNAAATGDLARFDATRTDGLAAAPTLSPPKSNWARPLTRAPFLAYPLVCGIAYTFGGIDTNDQAEVLGAYGPIKGLYAAGEITGHFYGLAPNAVAMLRALVFGRIAGTNAVRQLQEPRAVTSPR
jgi:tricarballylate dehydrogenase